MRWKINHFLFCETSLTLSDGIQILELEPRLVEVLSYFCRHPNIIISRDEFIEHVWNGQIVTDNAINRIVAKLRKALGDNAKSSKYILTYPKKGYRFIGSVCQYSESPPKAKSNSIFHYLIPLALLTIMLVVLMKSIPVNVISIQGARAITWGDTIEFDAAISPNGKYLAYSAETNGRSTLFIRDLKNSEIYQKINVEGNASGSQWSIDGTKLLYLYTDDKACQYRIVKFNSGIKSDTSIVHNCPLGSFGKALFSHDGNTIYYAERSDDSAPYYIFSLDLVTSTKTKLLQPDPLLSGNREFDLHPHENKLLITSPDDQQQLGFYEMNMDTNKLSFMFSKKGYICCAIWDHSGRYIVMMGDYPANGFISFGLNGENESIILDTNLRVGPPTRVPNSQDYLYAGGMYDFDIAYHALEDKHNVSFANSSTGDYLPVLDNNGMTLAFMSERSGKVQLWLQPIDTNIAHKLSTFSDNQRYYDLKWSPSGHHIALLTTNSIKIVEVATGRLTALKAPLQEIRSLSWKDNSHLAFSTKNEKKWRPNLYNIHSHKVALLNEQWAFVSFDSDGVSRMVVDQAGKLFFNDKKLTLEASQYFIRKERKMQFSHYNGRIYYQDENDNTLVEFDAATGSKKMLLNVKGSVDFSVSEQGVFLTEFKYRTSEIFRTYE